MRSSNATNNGSTAETGKCRHKGRALKLATMQLINKKNNYLTNLIT
jgi:hypothetical protein